MNISTWFDNRTLLTCQALVTAMFGLPLLGIHHKYPRIRGVRSMATGYLLGVPATLLLAMRGIVPAFLSIVVANLLVYTGYLFLYRGLTQFFGSKKHLIRFASLLTIATACAHIFYTYAENRIVIRIALASTFLGIFRIVMAILIARHAHGMFHRRLFAAFLIVFGLVSLARAPLTLLHGAPSNYLQQNAIQTFTLLAGVIFLSIDGIFYLTLLSFDVTSNMAQQAHVDVLTGTLNRRGIETRLNDELARAGRGGNMLCVMLLDLDRFKSINDTQGHNAGDAALRKVATAITATLRPFDHLGRFGGDEFLLILPELATAEAFRLAQLIRDSIRFPTLSIGIAQADPGESAPVLLARADIALYRAKGAGRDCIRVQRSNAAAFASHPTHTT